MSDKRQRNGFVTFWLWLGIICSIRLGIICSINSGIFGANAISSYRNLGSYGMDLIIAGVDYSHAANMLENASNILVITSIVSAICCIIGYNMLLKWKKAGFWLLIAASIVLSCFNLYAMGMISDAYSEIGLYLDHTTITITQMICPIISCIILWAILQIKKNGISCWSQLD